MPLNWGIKICFFWFFQATSCCPSTISKMFWINKIAQVHITAIVKRERKVFIYKHKSIWISNCYHLYPLKNYDFVSNTSRNNITYIYFILIFFFKWARSTIFIFLKLTANLHRDVKTKVMSMQNANVHVRWDLLEQLVKQSSLTLVCRFLSAVPLLSFVSILQRQCKTM